MDSVLTAAARALAAGDPVQALERIALLDDPPALALRAIAMAQLGELRRAKDLLKRAARGFPPEARVARARCTVAAAEIGLALRELGPVRGLEAAQAILLANGDRRNALHARLIEVRRCLLLGRLGEAEELLETIDLSDAPAVLVTLGELCKATIAERRLLIRVARASVERALQAARRAGVPALLAEVEHARELLGAPAARLSSQGKERLITLAEVEAVLGSDALVVDACRRCARRADRQVGFARRPVLFRLLCALAEAWPGDVPRKALMRRVFETSRPNDSHRARLRVELGRLRQSVRALSGVVATKDGFRLAPRGDSRVLILMPPIEGEAQALLALLADGEAWSTSGLALASGTSQRTVQRTLSSLESRGEVGSHGRGRARRWLAPPMLGFTTSLLLPTSFTRS